MKRKVAERGLIYQSSTGSVEVKIDRKSETVMLTQTQVASLFGVRKAAISKHVKNIFAVHELEKRVTVSILETVQSEGGRKVTRKVEYFNLDLILSVGYRVNSTKATKFRQWATKTLRQHILQGYTFNKKRITRNYANFLKAIDEVKKLLPERSVLTSDNALELAKMFASTWLSLDTYDKGKLPTSGINAAEVKVTIENISSVLQTLKTELVANKQASDLFGKERESGSLNAIVGNVFQSFDNHDLYPTVEEKAAHLLYFVVKDHPFVDGNKRNGAYLFIWFLQKTKLLNINKFGPDALTALTLLVAESRPTDKPKIIGLILLLLKK